MILQKIDPRPYKYPPFTYMGSKYRLLEELRLVFRQCRGKDTFIDCFAGSMAVSYDSRYSNLVVNDIDSNLIGFYKWCRDIANPDTIIDLCNEILEDYETNTEKGYYRTREAYNKEHRGDGAFLYVLTSFCFDSSPRFNSAGEFNRPWGECIKTFPERLRKFRDFILWIQSRNVELSSKDFPSLIKEKKDTNSLWYFDPPYLGSFSTYTSDWNLETQNRFLEYLSEFIEEKIPFVFSYAYGFKGFKNESLLDWIDKYNKNINIIYPKISYSNASSAKKSREDRIKEIMVYNFGEMI